jgi:hypothetical protein
MGRRFSGLILDWAGVLTTNMVEVIESFEAREGLSGFSATGAGFL